MSNEQETLGQTSPEAQAEYNKVRANELLSLRKRFYKQFPINHNYDEAFEDAVFREIKRLKARIENLEIVIERQKGVIERQGDRHEEKHNILCHVKEAIEEYFGGLNGNPTER